MAEDPDDITRITYTQPADAPAPPERKARTVDIAKQVVVDDPDSEEGQRVVERVERFTLSPNISSLTLMELADASTSRTTMREFSGVMLRTLRVVLPPDDYHRFRAFEAEVQPTILELQSWIGQMVGVITSRPTKGRSSSQPGPPETSTGSTAPGESAPETPPTEESAF